MRRGHAWEVALPSTPSGASRNRRAGLVVALTLGSLVLNFCHESPGAPVATQIVLGTWGADNAGVIVTDSVSHVHVGCTFGDWPPKVLLDADGRFTVNGSYVLRAYPVMIGPRLPAQFSGRVVGKTMTLTITVNDTVQKNVVALGPITVTFGRTPTMGPCPICLSPKAIGMVR